MKIKLKREKGRRLEIFTNNKDTPVSNFCELSRCLTGTTNEENSGVLSSVYGDPFECPRTKFYAFYKDDFCKKIEIELINYNYDTLPEIERKIRENVKQVKDWVLSIQEDDMLEFEI